MSDSALFVTCMLNDKIVVNPSMVTEDMQSYLEKTLREKYEGICSYHGYIKPGSIKIIKYSMGFVMSISLDGSVVYRVQYQASVCNPIIGNVIVCRVVNMNKFGILAEAGTALVDDATVNVLDVIVPKNSAAILSDIDLDAVRIGDEIHVEIKGKKFELHQKKISILARAVSPTAKVQVAMDRTLYEGGALGSLDEEVDNTEASEEDEETDDVDDEDDDDTKHGGDVTDDSDGDEPGVDLDDDDTTTKNGGGALKIADDEDELDLEEEDDIEDDDDDGLGSDSDYSLT